MRYRRAQFRCCFCLYRNGRRIWNQWGVMFGRFITSFLYCWSRPKICVWNECTTFYSCHSATHSHLPNRDVYSVLRLCVWVSVEQCKNHNAQGPHRCACACMTAYVYSRWRWNSVHGGQSHHNDQREWGVHYRSCENKWYISSQVSCLLLLLCVFEKFQFIHHHTVRGNKSRIRQPKRIRPTEENTNVHVVLFRLIIDKYSRNTRRYKIQKKKICFSAYSGCDKPFHAFIVYYKHIHHFQISVSLCKGSTNIRGTH